MPPQLHPLGPGVLHLPGAVSSVVVEGDGGRALLVDTGLDDTHARRLLRALDGAGLTPAAILNTHSHADHHGGNAFVLGRFPGLPVYAPPLEAAIIRHPLLEPLALWGAAPPAELRTRFLLAPASPARGVGPGVQTLGGTEVELLPVPGHAADMYAVRVGGVLYAADALFGPEALGKHPLTFCADSARQKASATALGELQGVSVVLPGHGEPTSDLGGLVAANLAAYTRTTEAVAAALAQGPATVDGLLGRVGETLGAAATTPGGWVLNRAVVSAHLTELLALGTAALELAGGVLRARQA